MKRIAIVVQRFGTEINGGAEAHARLLANALKQHYQVDVLTSRALDYRTWAPHYPLGEEQIDGCRVIRFDHSPRLRGRHMRMPLRPKLRWKLRRWLSDKKARVLRPTGNERVDGLRLLRSQGPTMEGLMRYLGEHGDEYQAIIFMTAMYHPSALGVLVKPHRSILVPTLHDEKVMYLPHFHRVFRAPIRIMYNTAAEEQVARRLYGEGLAPGDICGVGIDLPTRESASERSRCFSDLAKRHGIDTPYVLYVGRIDKAKGCDMLFEHFLRWRAERQAALKMVVVGQPFMTLPSDAHLVFTGFVTDGERDALIERAEAMAIPSRYESLSLVLLEALVRGCTVIVNRDSEVLEQHVHDSGVGETFTTYEEFAAALDSVLARSPEQRAAQAARGRRYVEERYVWSTIIEKFKRAIDSAPPTVQS